jgi:glutathione S-transferase
MLEELGNVPYEHLPYRPASRRVREHNPTGKVPILLAYDDPTTTSPSLTLTESVAINTYMGDLYPSSALVPTSGTRARAQYDQLCCTILSELDAQGLWMHRKHGTAMGKYLGGAIPEAVAAAQQHYTRMLPTLLPSDLYLLGKNFTAADILLVHCWDWAEQIGWNGSVSDEWREYIQRCHHRAAYQKVWALLQHDETSSRL